MKQYTNHILAFMEQSNSLLLNEEALRQCPDPTKLVFIYEWLRYLDRILSATRKVSGMTIIKFYFVVF